VRDLTIHDQTTIAQTVVASQPIIAPQTIVALCTPQGSGAIALLRISGNLALEIASRISVLASKQSLTSVPTHTIHYGFIAECSQEHSEKIDSVLFLVMHGPKTFTGEDTVEITCHNNPFIIEKIIELAISAGARHAHNGEFTRRAVLNNKIDIVQAESINELIHANTQVSLKQAMAQVNGSFSSWIGKLEKNILKALAFCEASFEFLDEEITFDQQIKSFLQETIDTINHVKLTFDKQQNIRQGIRVAIIGSVNVGKSSIFNALLHQQRAIVTNIAGTTRDVIEAGVYKNGNYWTLIDTAGLRETADVIEQEGITRSLEQAQLADIILLAFDRSRELTSRETEVYAKIVREHEEKIIYVHNKADLPAHASFGESKHADLLATNTGQDTDREIKDKKVVAVSAHANTGIQALELAIENRILAIFASVTSPFLLNKRHHHILLALEKDLTHILSFFDSSPIPYELVAYHLNDALAHLSDLTGKTVSEQAMDAIFREFCVGK
jgi:tRNA modification GTPase